MTEFSSSSGAGPTNLTRAFLKAPPNTDIVPKFEVERFGVYVTYAWCLLSVSRFGMDKLAL